MEQNIRVRSVNCLNSMDSIKDGMRSILGELIVKEEAKPGSVTAEIYDDDYYDKILERLRHGLLKNYFFLSALGSGHSEDNNIMEMFISDKNRMNEISRGQQ